MTFTNQLGVTIALLPLLTLSKPSNYNHAQAKKQNPKQSEGKTSHLS